MNKKVICGECGSSNVSLSNVKGEKFPYKSFPAVILSCDLDLHVCQDCENVILKTGDSKALDVAIEKSIGFYCQSFINNILSKTKWTQAELADFIGFTSIYISQVKNGKIPEYKTFNYLKLLSECHGAIECVIWDDPRCKDIREGYQFTGELSVESKARVKLRLAADSYEDLPLIA